MISVDKIAIIWSVVIVAIAVGFATVGNMSSETNQGDNTPAFVYPNAGAKQTMETAATSIFLQTDRKTYSNNDQIQVSGSVGKKILDLPITLLVIDPNEDIVSIAQLNVDDKRNFSETINIGGPLWKQEGEYTIKVHYGEKNTAKTTFDFVLPAVTSELSDVFNVYVEDRVFSVEYGITNSNIKNMAMISDCLCLVVTIDSQDRGVLTVDLPRNMIDAISQGDDDIFFVLMDGIEIPYEEISANSQSRTIQIQFDKGTSELEIIGSNPT